MPDFLNLIQSTSKQTDDKRFCVQSEILLKKGP
jgi:hypothetical protein